MSLSQKKRAVFAFLFFIIFFNSLHQPETVDLHLDPSWKAVLQYSQYHGLSIGDNIAFTYGPFGFISTAMQVYVGYKSFAWAGYFIGLTWSCALAISCLYLTKNSSFPIRVLILILCAFLPIRYMDSANYFILFTAGIYLMNDANFYSFNLLRWIIFIVAAFTIALTKFTYFPIFITLFFGALSSNILKKQYKYAIFTSTALLLLTLISFFITNTTIVNFYHYIINSIHISFDYNQAMMIGPKTNTLICGLVTLTSLISLFFLGFFRFNKSTFRFESILFAFVTFISWKAGYTRADGHVFVFLDYGLLCICYASWLYEKINPNLRSILVACCILPVISLLGASRIFNTLSSPDDLRCLLLSPCQKFINFVSFHSYISNLDNKWSEKIKLSSDEKLRKIVGNKPVDVFGFFQGIAIINQLNYLPNPTIQSYTSYNKQTQKIGLKSHLDFPRNILFRLDPIDHRLPTMGGALLQRHVLWNMDYIEQVGNYLLFSPRENINREILNIDFPNYSACSFNSWIELTHQESDCVFLNVRFQKNLVGKFSEILYQTDFIYIIMELDDGRILKYRYIPSAGEHGVLVSPLLENNNDICKLLELAIDKPLDEYENANLITSNNRTDSNFRVKSVKRIKFTSESFSTTPIGYNSRILYTFKTVSPPN